MKPCTQHGTLGWGRWAFPHSGMLILSENVPPFSYVFWRAARFGSTNTWYSQKQSAFPPQIGVEIAWASPKTNSVILLRRSLSFLKSISKILANLQNIICLLLCVKYDRYCG